MVPDEHGGDHDPARSRRRATGRAPGRPAGQPLRRPVREPRERWVNPAKRRAASALALVAALVLLGAGVLIGLAVGGDDHGHHYPGLRPARGGQLYPGLNERGMHPDRGRFPGPGRDGVPFPGGRPGFRAPATSGTGTTPAGAPATTSTTSPTASATASPATSPTSSHR